MRIIDAISVFFDRKELRWIKKTLLWKAIRFLYNLIVYIFKIMFLPPKRDNGRKTVFIMVYSLYGGGAERVATILANELSKIYHIVLLYVCRKKNSYPVSSAVDAVQIPLIFSDIINVQNLMLRYVKKLKKAQDAFASISFLYSMNALNVASKVNDIVICSERNNPTKSADADKMDQIAEIYEKADHVVFQSAAVQSLFSDTIRAHSTILPNPVGVTCLRKASTRHRIVTCGRLVQQKNHEMLIRAFSAFHKQHPDYTLSIYGDGVLHQEMAALIQSLSLNDAVILEGQTKAIHEAIADAEFFVLSSDFEGLSNALLEAMMMGFPCISTDCEGSVDVIENGKNGLLVPRGNEQEMLKAMLTLAENPDYREQLAQEALRTSEYFKREKVAEKWAELIERIA